MTTSRWFSRRRQTIAGAALLVVVLLVWWARQPPTIVQATEVRRGGMLVAVTTNGKVEPIDDIEIRARLDGRVVDIVDAGKQVAAGDVVVRLDDALATSALAAARAERLSAQEALRAARDAGATAEERLATDERLQREGALTRERLTESRAAARDARARTAYLEQDTPLRVSSLDAKIADLEAQIAAAVVRAPVAGTVYRTQAKKGEMVHVGDPLAWMADLQRLRVRANVDQVDLGRVQPEQLVHATANAFPGRGWTGRITEVTPHVVVRENRSLSESLARIDPPTDGLVPGMTVDLEIVISDASDVLQVGADALVGDQRDPSVYRIDGKHVHRTPVKVGRTNATDVEILDGLAEKDRVVVSPRPDLVDGARVTIRKRDVPAES